MIRRISAGVLASAAALMFGATLVHAVGYSPDSDMAASNVDTVPVTVAHAAAPAQYPVRIQIPSLGVDAKVQYVGITARGTMSVPNNFSDVGWYKYGAVPGTPGAAVFAGHVDNALALPGVFKRLEDIEIGADVYVQEKGGGTLHFVVDDVQSYDANEAPTSRIFDMTTQEARLNLVTCQGAWIQAERQYDRRLVVYTHLVSSSGITPKPQQILGPPTSAPDTAADVVPEGLETSTTSEETLVLPEILPVSGPTSTEEQSVI